MATQINGLTAEQIEQEIAASDVAVEDLPDVGDTFEDPITARHFEVTRAGPLEVELHEIGGHNIRTIDSRVFPAKLVEEEG